MTGPIFQLHQKSETTKLSTNFPNLHLTPTFSQFPTFPWSSLNSLTFPDFPGRWSPWWLLFRILSEHLYSELAQKKPKNIIMLMITATVIYQCQHKINKSKNRTYIHICTHTQAISISSVVRGLTKDHRIMISTNVRLLHNEQCTTDMKAT